MLTLKKQTNKKTLISFFYLEPPPPPHTHTHIHTPVTISLCSIANKMRVAKLYRVNYSGVKLLLKNWLETFRRGMLGGIIVNVDQLLRC